MPCIQLFHTGQQCERGLMVLLGLRAHAIHFHL